MIGIVMPAYNAEKTMSDVIEKIPEKVLNDSMVIIVDDGSTDNTFLIATKIKEKYPITIIRHEKNLGYGAAQKTGFDEVLKHRLEIAVVLHADGQYDPQFIESIIRPIKEKGVYCVGGSRLLKGNCVRQGMPVFKFVGNYLLTKLLNYRYCANIWSYHSGYKAYSKECLQAIDYERLPDSFSFDTSMLVACLKKGLSVEDVAIKTTYGEEISYLRPIRYGIEILRIIMRGAKS